MSAKWRMSAGDSRTLRRGVIAIASIVAIGKGMPALRAAEARARSAAAEAAQEVSALRAAAKGQAVMRDSLKVRTRRLETLRGSLIHAPTPQLAAAELAKTLGEYAAGVEARVNAVVVRSDSTFTKGVARVFVRLSIATDVQGIAEVLNAIEADPWLVGVREMSIAGNDPSAPSTRTETLVVELLVEGLALEDKPADARDAGAAK